MWKFHWWCWSKWEGVHYSRAPIWTTVARNRKRRLFFILEKHSIQLRNGLLPYCLPLNTLRIQLQRKMFKFGIDSKATMNMKFPVFREEIESKNGNFNFNAYKVFGISSAQKLPSAYYILHSNLTIFCTATNAHSYLRLGDYQKSYAK